MSPSLCPRIYFSLPAASSLCEPGAVVVMRCQSVEWQLPMLERPAAPAGKCSDVVPENRG